MTRRNFVSTVAGTAAMLAGSALAARGAADGAAPAASSRRRVIWNNDGDDLRFVAFRGTRSSGIEWLWTARNPNALALPEKFSSVQEFLDLRMTALRGIPVDTISFCGIFNWPAWEMRFPAVDPRRISNLSAAGRRGSARPGQSGSAVLVRF